MRPDLYTKAVLTVIAIMLTVIVCNQYLNPTTARAQGTGSVQFSGEGFSFNVYDPRSGDFWLYEGDGRVIPFRWLTTYLGKMNKPGNPLTGGHH